MSSIIKKFAVAGTLAVAAIATAVPASAVTIKNCSGQVVRTNVFNNDDVLLIAPKGGGKIGPNDSRSFHVNSRHATVVIYKAGLFDKGKSAYRGLARNGSYVIRPGYQLASGRRC